MKITTHYYDSLIKTLSDRNLRRLSPDELSIVGGLLHDRLEFVQNLVSTKPRT
ncbi:hypothetical protein [Mycobacterium lentiflavum]|uniref:Phage protein n=1 Tax=Mycobacterium lentiflavum TaxID=141349 RepID=A0ABY3V3Y2_MYCLN|nr:hypothetical protein [Mycobacterium lentiflavum]ULP44269.1 hypothetical protein MJO58_10185 [Mycobacterium lentiflavum]